MRQQRAQRVFPLEWHRKCIENSESSLARDEEMLKLKTDEIAGHRARVEVMKTQYAEALRRGVTEYDPEKFGVKRKQS